MLYSKGYKYALQKQEVFYLPLALTDTDRYIDTYYCKLEADKLTIFSGYAWDGASGIMPDFKSTMRASLFHDCWYQLIREGYEFSDTREAADIHYRDLCIGAGMSKWLANVQLTVLKDYIEQCGFPPKKVYEV